MKRREQVAQRINSRFYYGWLMLAVGMVGNFCSGPGQTFTVSVFIDPLIAEFGLSRAAISSAYATGTMIGALGLSLVGVLIDRHGSRVVLTGAGAMLGVTCWLFPQAGGLAGLYLLFTAQRFFGQGTIPLACNNLVSQWFLRRRGLALSLLGVGENFRPGVGSNYFCGDFASESGTAIPTASPRKRASCVPNRHCSR